MKCRDDHEGDLCGEIHEDDDDQHHRDSSGVSARNVCRNDGRCTSTIMENFKLIWFSLPAAQG